MNVKATSQKEIDKLWSFLNELEKNNLLKSSVKMIYNRVMQNLQTMFDNCADKDSDILEFTQLIKNSTAMYEILQNPNNSNLGIEDVFNDNGSLSHRRIYHKLTGAIVWDHPEGNG